LTQKHNAQASFVDEFWQTFVDSGTPRTSVALRPIEERYATLLGWANAEQSVRSIIGYIRALFSLPNIEPTLLTGSGGPVEQDPEPSVVREYFESPAYRAWKKRAEAMHSLHPERRNKKMYALSYALFTDKFGWTKSQSWRSVLVDFLNFKKSVRDLQPMRLLVAYCDGNSYGTPLSLYSVLAALLPEASALYEGVEVFSANEKKPDGAIGDTVWVYANLALLIADSQERWRFVSVNPPSGSADYCCPMCHASLADFARAASSESRDFVRAKESIARARELPTQKEQKEELAKEHLHLSALHNPLFRWPGVEDLFAIAPPDALHLCLFYFKVLVKELVRSLSPNVCAIVEQRAALANSILEDAMRVSKLEHRKTWKGWESRNFGLLSPWLLRDLVDSNVLDIWTDMATLFSMLYSPERDVGLAFAVGAIARRLVASILKTYPGKDGKYRKQLNLHSPLHFDKCMLEFGPAGIFDTERAESAQSRVADFAKQTTRVVQRFTMRSAACWQAMSLEEL